MHVFMILVKLFILLHPLKTYKHQHAHTWVAGGEGWKAVPMQTAYRWGAESSETGAQCCVLDSIKTLQSRWSCRPVHHTARVKIWSYVRVSYSLSNVALSAPQSLCTTSCSIGSGLSGICSWGTWCGRWRWVFCQKLNPGWSFGCWNAYTVLDFENWNPFSSAHDCMLFIQRWSWRTFDSNHTFRAETNQEIIHIQGASDSSRSALDDTIYFQNK